MVGFDVGINNHVGNMVDRYIEWYLTFDVILILYVRFVTQICSKVDVGWDKNCLNGSAARVIRILSSEYIVL